MGPKQSQYPNYTKYYFELRREGLPFNPQFDASKIPDFAPPAPASGGTNAAQMAEDQAVRVSYMSILIKY